MNAPLIAAGCLGLLGAAIHGGAGELLVVRKLSPEGLPPTSLGGPRMTMAMVHASWHLTTIAFVTVGCGLLLSGTALDGDAARAVAVLGASACTGFAGLVLGLGLAHLRTPAGFLRHPAPILLTLTAVLAWWGALTV